jgi:acyl-CoA thioester hydrolase
MFLLDYIHELPIQIRFNDIDKLSHLNNACYLTFFELGRVNYFNKILKTPVNWDEQGFILAHTEINHLQPIYLNDDVYCYTKVIRLGSKSLTVKNALVKKQNNELIICAEGTGVLVAMDYKKKLSILIPEAWRKLIKEEEKI